MASGTTYSMSRTYSRTGFLLSLIGGGLIILQGLIAIFFTSLYVTFVYSLGLGVSVFLIGIMLVILGLIIYSSAYALTRSPDQHVIIGASIIIFSVLALVLGGGYLIGSALGIIGGIVAIISRG